MPYATVEAAKLAELPAIVAALVVRAPPKGPKRASTLDTGMPDCQVTATDTEPVPAATGARVKERLTALVPTRTLAFVWARTTSPPEFLASRRKL